MDVTQRAIHPFVHMILKVTFIHLEVKAVKIDISWTAGKELPGYESQNLFLNER
jgi:hypothetical protein